jgi:lipoprotein-anchoring transpeptidase ErfK/SrfK
LRSFRTTPQSSPRTRLARQALKTFQMISKTPLLTFALTCATMLLAGRSNAQANTAVVVSVRDQQLAIVKDGARLATFPISTSKFGLGDRPRSYSTPLGTMQVAEKIGGGAPLGAVFKSRRRTGEVLRPNSPGRDPIVTRILWLRGLESQNSRAYSRNIYIHGTAEERKIGRPASYGCIRMRSKDVVRVFESVPVGTRVEVINGSLKNALREIAGEARNSGHAG